MERCSLVSLTYWHRRSLVTINRTTFMRWRLAFLFCLTALARGAATGGYIGSSVCAGCHKQIAATQAMTNMARTWKGASTQQLSSSYSQTTSEDPEPAINYSVARTSRGFEYKVNLPGRPAFSAPVETMVGGERHGLSFLVRVPEVEGELLPRAPLIETRYLNHAPENRLILSPGVSEEKPRGFEAALGHVLSPAFERKCLACHGEPRSGISSGGVTCEHCHGPGRTHLVALAKHTADKGIINPKRLSAAGQIAVCAACHRGFANVVDPVPQDLAISNQVTAIQNSECFRQSGGNITCTGCHDPHRDAPRQAVAAASVQTCLGCHSEKLVRHAAVCPVNQTGQCIGCHMPNQSKGSFTMADHWIRVHPEQGIAAKSYPPGFHSQITPKYEYLRFIVTQDQAQAAAAEKKLEQSVSFFDVAREYSKDDTAGGGGYLGDIGADKMNPAWAAAALKLAPGEKTPIVNAGGRFYIVQRLPRNFRAEADTHYLRAMDLRRQGKREESQQELLAGLQIYPAFLRGLTWLGISVGEGGSPERGAAILEFATRLYPNDAGANLNLGIAYEALGRTDDANRVYRKAIEIDPDALPAYLNLGSALFTTGKYDDAAEVYRKGLEVDPLSASLNYSLAVTLEKSGKLDEANRALTLAKKIDPAVGSPPSKN
jgi:predicted CXXCH cytochrome family protein